MITKTIPWDVADHLDTPEAIAGYINAVLEEDDQALLAAAIGDVARARGMSDLAKATGLSREALYKALSSDGNPSLSTLTKVLGALGLRIEVSPMEQDNKAA